MYVSFHKDPADIPSICTDLQEHDAVFIETTRTNFEEITRLVEAEGVKVLPLSAQAPDGDFHNFLLSFESDQYQLGVTEKRVLKGIVAWHFAGSPVPHLERV
jgi:hypothetical protein